MTAQLLKTTYRPLLISSRQDDAAVCSSVKIDLTARDNTEHIPDCLRDGHLSVCCNGNAQSGSLCNTHTRKAIP